MPSKAMKENCRTLFNRNLDSHRILWKLLSFFSHEINRVFTPLEVTFVNYLQTTIF